jgi:4-hydroxy-4-methyl-2-oxoglutarate aldolase
MASLLTPEELGALARIDSATVSNAIETFNVRDHTAGYTSLELRCLTPELPPMVGYAITCTSDSTMPGPRRPTKEHEFFEAIAAAPKPAILVIKDMGTDRLRSCYGGDVLATIARRLGAIGLVTDGGVRDLAGIRQRVPGFQVFASGFVVSHGIPTFLDVGVTVSICGVPICPGDLLHGDENGLLVIPSEVAGRVAAQAEAILTQERDLIAFIHSDSFSLEGLKERMSH